MKYKSILREVILEIKIRHFFLWTCFQARESEFSEESGNFIIPSMMIKTNYLVYSPNFQKLIKKAKRTIKMNKQGTLQCLEIRVIFQENVFDRSSDHPC